MRMVYEHKRDQQKKNWKKTGAPLWNAEVDDETATKVNEKGDKNNIVR